ncbi:MAG: hypothetical protein HN350_13025 [Phycisphaerales bacterium]|jgi:hypothetical protein|nr:hypothetical protein [Phycisphaerales bacterium]
MAYKCPRCGEPVQRGHSRGAQMAGGLVGALFYAAFGSFQCEGCGKIPGNEFPAEDRSKMRVGSLMLVGGAIVLFAAVVGVLIAINS